MALAVSVASSGDDLLRLAPAWEALADEVGAPLFSRPFWCLPWARHLPHGHPHVMAVHDGTDLVAVAPISLRRIGPIELVRFLGHGLGTVSSLLSRPEHPTAHTELWAAVLAGRRRFAQLLEHRATGAQPPVARGWPSSTVPHDACPTVDCSVGFDAYCAARPKKLRENLRRAERALAADGRSYSIEVVTEPGRWLEVRAEAVQVFDAAEAARPRQHMFQGELGALTDDVLRTAAEAGKLRLLVGRVDGRPASLGIAFVSAGTLSYWITRFDPHFAAASVGILLLRSVIQLGFDEGVDTVDLLLGNHGYKRWWGTESYDTLTVLAASSPRLLQAGTATLGAAARLRGRA